MTEPFDFLVLGSGIAGLTTALKLADAGRVAVVTKKEDRTSATNYAQGGIAAVLSPLDDFESHIADTLKAGAGLCRPEAVRVMVREAPRLIGELLDLGVDFNRTETPLVDEGAGEAPDGGSPLRLGREGGHTHSRIVHVHDLTGQEVERALVEAVTSHPNVLMFENHIGVDLITEHFLGLRRVGEHQTVYGAYVLDTASGEVEPYPARLTFLATGGCGQVYRHTTNPDIATGDGLAMAARAGSRLANLEFMQFHPTSLYGTGDPAFLISEAVRGFGAILRDHEGRAFMESEHELRDLAPRDIVARAIDRRLKESGNSHVLLDLSRRTPAAIEERFPNIVKTCRELGIDPATEPIPVVPAAHYMCGGLPTDLAGQTDLGRLFAIGEVACTGVHGANRLASNSLLEGLVFAELAARRGREVFAAGDLDVPDVPPWDVEGTHEQRERVMTSHDRDGIRNIMWDYVGIVRSVGRLERAARRLTLIAREIENYYRWTRVTGELLELRNLAQVALLITRSALSRPESRGLHNVTDYPEADPELDERDTLTTLQWKDITP